MKDKILASLKTKYKTLGLSEKSFDGVAEYLSKIVKEESEISNVVDGAEIMLKAVQGEADRVRADSTIKFKELMTEKEKLEAQLKDQKPTLNPNGGGAGKDDIPEWAKSLQETVKGLAELRQQEQQQQTLASKRSEAKALMLKNEIDESLCDDILNDISISNDDTPEIIANKGVDKYNYFKTKFVPESGAPHVSTGGGGANLDDFFESKKAEAEANVKNLKDVDFK